MRYLFLDFTLETEARELRRGDERVHLTPKAFDLLVLLLTSRPRAIPKSELYDQLWPSTFVVEANLPILVREIRRALDDRKREIVRTVHGTGYAFAAVLREERGSPAVAPATVTHTLQLGEQQFVLQPGDNIVGRGPEAAVFLSSPSVSRRHALITIDKDIARVTDMKSKNGTFVGADRLQPSATLADGDLVKFGDIVTRYRCSSPEQPTVSL